MKRSEWIDQVNRNCFCFPLDRETYDKHLNLKLPSMATPLASREHLFAGTGVLIENTDVRSMLDVIEAVETLVKLPRFKWHTLNRSGIAAKRRTSETHGMLMSYDFHITDDGPQLIEVNTNAGGAFLAAEIQTASSLRYPGCCGFKPLLFNDGFNHSTSSEQNVITRKNSENKKAAGGTNNSLQHMLLQEWASSGKTSNKPDSLAIVDEDPAGQYLYPEMLLAQQLFENAGIRTQIVDINDLRFEAGQLTAAGLKIDMVYNRSTDFLLEKSQSEAMHRANATNTTLVSPAPRHYALYADKRNLVLMTDELFLKKAGLSQKYRSTLSNHVPKSWLLSNENADELFSNRRNLFFKPVNGYGSRAVYRGDKMTRRVWEQIKSDDYIAQTYIPPSVRAVNTGRLVKKVSTDDHTNRPVNNTPGNVRPTQLKFDIRLYTIAGQPLLPIARIYNGQTTNFRTTGGGFAPVYCWHASAADTSEAGVRT